MIRRLGLVALAVLVYLPALSAPFVFDDGRTVVDNPSIRDLANLKWIFIGSRRFVTNFSYALDRAVFGPGPLGFHLTNLLLHALVVLALFELIRRLLDEERALVAAALFAVHPLLSESVAYVSSRAGLLCALFLLLGVQAWHRALTGRRAWAIAAVAAWILGAASKETGLLAPVLWLACDLLFVEGARRRLPGYLAVGLVGGAAGALRVLSFLRLESGAGHDLGLRLLTQAEVLWRYLFLWVAPVGLSLVHAVPRTASAAAWLSAASLAVAVAVLYSVRRRRPAATFGGTWFLVLLLPTSVMPLKQAMAEHRVYEAAAGLALLTALALPRRRLVAGALVLLLGAVTMARVELWRQPVRLWQDAAEKAPREWLPHYNYADALRLQGDYAHAIDEYTAAVACAPADVRARRNRAICQALLGRFDEAEAELQRELVASPIDPAVHYNLGVLAAQRGHLEAARSHWLRALELDPAYTRPCHDLKRLFPEQVPPECRGQIR